MKVFWTQVGAVGSVQSWLNRERHMTQLKLPLLFQSHAISLQSNFRVTTPSMSSHSYPFIAKYNFSFTYSIVQFSLHFFKCIRKIYSQTLCDSLKGFCHYMSRDLYCLGLDFNTSVLIIFKKCCDRENSFSIAEDSSSSLDVTCI